MVPEFQTLANQKKAAIAALHGLVLCLLFSSLVIAHAQGLHPVPPNPPPPPPPPNVDAIPRTPMRIEVGCQVQSAYPGPAREWHNNGTAFLSDGQIAELEETASASPNDLCSRAYLVAHAHDRVPHHMDHVLWIIENHPEWNGFLLNLSWCGGDNYDGIKAAWLRCTGRGQRNGAVLHNAAVFFAVREPEFAEQLLKRAIQMEPDEQFHLEGLGALYGRSASRHPDSNFGAHARSSLLASDNWFVVAGGLASIQPSGKISGNEFTSLLRTKLERLSVPAPFIGLPSQTSRLNARRCEFVPLLRRCEDSKPH